MVPLKAFCSDAGAESGACAAAVSRTRPAIGARVRSIGGSPYDRLGNALAASRCPIALDKLSPRADGSLAGVGVERRMPLNFKAVLLAATLAAGAPNLAAAAPPGSAGPVADPEGAIVSELVVQ